MEDFTPTKIRKLKRKARTSQFATWNVQGKLWEPSEIEKFARDMRNRKIQICAIQETRNSGEYEYRTGNTGAGRPFNIPGKTKGPWRRTGVLCSQRLGVQAGLLSVGQ